MPSDKKFTIPPLPFAKQPQRIGMSPPRFLLNPQSLAAQVPGATYNLGLLIYLKQEVLECHLSGAKQTEWTVTGLVQGTARQPYEIDVELHVALNGNLTFYNAVCSCPVRKNCKHSVALTLKAGYTSGQTRSTANLPNTPSNRPAAQTLEPDAGNAQQETQVQVRQRLEQKQAQQKVSQWLDQFAHESLSNSQAFATPPDTPIQDDEKLVYMLASRPSKNGPLLVLGYGLSRRLRNGQWAKVKQPRHLGQTYGLPAQDMEIARLIETLATRTYSFYSANCEGILSGATGFLALQLAASTGRLFTCTQERVLGQPLQLGAPKTLRWSWQETTANDATEPLWRLQAQIEHSSPVEPGSQSTPESTQWFANTPPLYLDGNAGLCGAIEVPGMSAEHLSLLVQAPPIPESAFALHETTLLRNLAGLPLPPVLKAPQVWQGITPISHLALTPQTSHDVPRLGLLKATLTFDYQGLRHYAQHARNPVLLEHRTLDPATQEPTLPQRVMLQRDLATEQTALSFLQQQGLVGNPSGEFFLPFVSNAQQQLWLQWADEDFAPLRQAGFLLDLAPALTDWITRADALDVQMATPSNADSAQAALADANNSHPAWFELSLGMQINGQRHNILPLLPALLKQLHAPSNPEHATDTSLVLPPYVYLPQPDGTYLRLPTEPLRPWLYALIDLVSERGDHLNGDSLRLSRLEALRLSASLGEGVHWQGGDSLRHMVRQLAGHSALPVVPVPQGLVAELRPYQQQGLEWLQFLRANGLAGILADDMGLGKTLQTLAHILVEKQAGRLDRPALILAPVSLMGNWRREAERFTPALRALVLHGADRHEAATDMANNDLVIAPYSLLQRDRERWQAQAWHMVVLDEAQNIKNANTHAAQIVAELNTRHRLCLSGTPMENHLGELWSLFHFLMPGFLGSQARFKALFRTPIEKQGNTERLEQLRRRVTPFMLRRSKNAVATDLPEKQEAITSVELSGKQADLYETIRLTTEKAVREALATKGLAQSQIQVLDALLKLRQVCCDPRLVPLASAKKIKQSAKLELLMELLPELLAEGRRVLLFSQFTSMLTLIEEELQKHPISWVKLTGQSQKRDQIIERFTSGQVPLFLISLKAGGVGLNLTQADTVIHYDPWWNPAVENQATDRAHRIGQTQRVMVYKLVAQGTIEERILALQERKAALANSMYSQATARKQPLFTENDLAELLKPLGT